MDDELMHALRAIFRHAEKNDFLSAGMVFEQAKRAAQGEAEKALLHDLLGFLVVHASMVQGSAKEL